MIVELQKRWARVSYHDPHVPTLSAAGVDLESRALTAAALAAADCVVVITDHSALDWDLIGAHARLIVDTRNALRGRAVRARVVKL